MHKSWKLIWSDDFKNGEINPKYWNLQVEKAGRFNQEWQRYTNCSKNSFVENNYLVLKAIHEGDQHGHNQYTSARLNTAQKITFTYIKIKSEHCEKIH